MVGGTGGDLVFGVDERAGHTRKAFAYSSHSL